MKRKIIEVVIVMIIIAAVAIYTACILPSWDSVFERVTLVILVLILSGVMLMFIALDELVENAKWFFRLCVYVLVSIWIISTLADRLHRDSIVDTSTLEYYCYIYTDTPCYNPDGTKSMAHETAYHNLSKVACEYMVQNGVDKLANNRAFMDIYNAGYDGLCDSICCKDSVYAPLVDAFWQKVNN